MKNATRLFWATLALSINSFACDVCGCSLGGFSQGVMPDYNSHFVGLRYSHAGFHSRIDHTSLNQGFEESEDSYQRTDLVFRYNFGHRLKMNVLIPYLFNSMQGTHQRIATQGIGDPIAMINYQLLKEAVIRKNHFLTVGGGIKLPLGHYSLQDNGTLVNRNFQLGTGSFDFLLNSNYFYRRNKKGVMAEASWKLNTANKQNYRFGNQLNGMVNYVFMTGKNKFNFLSFAGLYGELAGRHCDNGAVVFNTGGRAVFANLGAQVYWGQVRIGASIQYPLYQNYLTDNITEITSRLRFGADLIFFFGGN